LFDIQVPGLKTNQAWIKTGGGGDTQGYLGLMNHTTLTTSPDARDFSVNVLVLQGIFDPTGRVLLQLKPVFRFPWLSRPTLRPPPEVIEGETPAPTPTPRPTPTPPLMVRVTDVERNVLTVPFDARVGDDTIGGPKERFGFFEVMIPLATEVASLDVFNIDGVRVGGFVRSKPPTIEINFPRQGMKLGKVAKVRWEVEDGGTPRKDLLFQVAFSPDNGASFVPVGVDQTGNELIFDGTQIPPSRGTGLIRVFVSDGLNTRFADVAGLSSSGSEDDDDDE
jgi:hypothetical protein